MNGDIVYLLFKILDNAAVGVTPVAVTYNPDDVYNDNLDNVFFYSISGSVEVVDYIPGDVNNDGITNTKDSVTLRRYLALWTNMEINLSAADVNGDGTVNTKYSVYGGILLNRKMLC